MAESSEDRIQVTFLGSDKIISGLQPTTTCRDLIDALQENGTPSTTSSPQIYLFEQWRSFQRRVGAEELISSLVSQWDSFPDEVTFIARYLSTQEKRLDAYQRRKRRESLPRRVCGRHRQVHLCRRVQAAVDRSRLRPISRALRQRLVRERSAANERTVEKMVAAQEEAEWAQRRKELQGEMERLKSDLDRELRLSQRGRSGHERSDGVGNFPGGEQLQGEVDRLQQELQVRSKLRAHRQAQVTIPDRALLLFFIPFLFDGGVGALLFCKMVKMCHQN